MNVDWAGKCDIQLDGNMIPTLVCTKEKQPEGFVLVDLAADSFVRESKVSHFMADFPYFWVQPSTLFR